MIKRIENQSKPAYEYTCHLVATKTKRTRGLVAAMHVQRFVVFPVLEIGDWRPSKKVSW